ncbi:MAG: sucrase ferredoxin [Nakamurella sp.]
MTSSPYVINSDLDPSTGLPCSDADRASGDSPIGSGTPFDSFLLLDYRAPWGRAAADDAVRDRLSPATARFVTDQPRLRAFAIRPVRDRRETPVHLPAFGLVGQSAAMVTLPSDADSEDFAAAGDLLRRAQSATRPTVEDIVIGVCTNAKRDRCCAVRGRPVAIALSNEFGEHITEISHLGGHRFAATMLVLPTGYIYGFLAPDSAAEAVRAAMDGLVHPANLRGRADLSPAAQAADCYWRAQLGPAPLDTVQITAENSADSVGQADSTLVTAIVQGTGARVQVRYEPGAQIAETLCGGKPINTGRWVVEDA